jgi:outer membrane receptor for ferric coprogen and ferric-rhodotorulic acid
MTHRHRAIPRLSTLVLALAAAMPAAYAQDASQSDSTKKDTTTLDAVSVQGQRAPTYTADETSAATRLPLTPQDTPQSLSIITEQRIEDQHLTNVRAVLDNTTGVSSSQYDTERVVFWSRGFQIENVANDGVPVAPGLNAGSADATLDTAIYDRIEVLRGASGLLSGAGSPAALINFVRKHADSKTLRADATVSYGSWNTKRAEFDISSPLNASGSVRGRVVGVHEDGNSYLDRYSNKKNVFYAVLDADLGENTVLSVGYDYQKSKPDGVTWGTFPTFYDDGTQITWPRSFSSAANWTFWNQTTQTAFADLKHTFDNGWQVHAMASHRQTDGDDALFYVYGFPNRDTGEGITPYAYRSRQHGRQNMLDVYASGPFEAFGREHELVVGASGSHYSNDAYEYAHGDLPDVGNFLDWTGQYAYPDFAATADRASLVRVEQKGLYAAARFSLADPLKLVVGARRTSWKNDTDDASAGLYYQKQDKTIPYAGLIYDITPTYSAFASYTQIFDPQDNRRADGSFLDPMVGSSREVGIKGRHFGGALNTSLTFFDTRLSSVAEADVGQLLPDGITQAYNSVDGTRSRGYEFEASGAFSDDWNGTLGWSHFNVKGPDHSGELRPALPRTLVRLFTTYRLPGALNKLTIGGGTNWQAASHTPVDGPNGPQRVDQSSVFLVTAMARYAFDDRASVQLNGDNLLNRKYFVLDEYSNLYYAPPSTYTVSFNYRFF